MPIPSSRTRANGSAQICRTCWLLLSLIIRNTLRSLIYQLLEYEKTLKGGSSSPTPSEKSSALADEEEEWGRRRRMLDESPSDAEDERESTLIMREAQALDKAMEDRVVARKNSASSVISTGSGMGMGPAWRNRYSNRKRTGSVGSNMTNGSILSEDLVEEEEEQELLGVGGGFDDERGRGNNTELEESSATNSPDDDPEETLQCKVPFNLAIRVPSLRPPPSAPAWKASFTLPPAPATATRATFGGSSHTAFKPKRRPPPMNLLPPVPPSPIALLVGDRPPPPPPPSDKINKPVTLQPAPRKRIPSRKLAPPPLHLRNTLLKNTNALQQPPSTIGTPHQTLFVFPPSPTTITRTPSTMTLTSSMNTPLAFPSMSTPRVSTFKTHGRTRSFIGLGAPATPTTAFSKVDARGYIGLE